MARNTQNSHQYFELIDSISNSLNKQNSEIEFTITKQEKRRPIIIIPGLLNSRLIDNKTNEIIWDPTPAGLLSSVLLGTKPKMNYDEKSEENTSADKIANRYNHLIDFLVSLGYSLKPDRQTLFTLPYDWRNSNMKSANRELNNIISEIKKIGFEQVDIIAHSMGGILARCFMEKIDRENSVNRLITLGTPHYGAPLTYAFLKMGLLRQRMFKIFDWNVNAEKFKQVGIDYPSVYELLPDAGYFEKLSVLGPIVKSNGLSDFGQKDIANPQKLYIENSITRISQEKSHSNLIQDAIKLKTDIGWKASKKVPTFSFYSNKHNTIGGVKFDDRGKSIGYDTIPGDFEIPWASEKLLVGAYAIATDASHTNMIKDRSVHNKIAEILRTNIFEI